MSNNHGQRDLFCPPTAIPVEVSRAIKRLNEAAGYLELGLSQRALDALDGITGVHGVEGMIAFLRGQGLRMQSKFGAAAVQLEAAAETLPTPVSRQVWLAASECYGASGRPDLAQKSLAKAHEL